MENQQFETLLQFFKILGNESRLKILGLLANKEWSVNELAEFLDLKEPTVSHHLAMMKKLGIVQARAEGNSRIYCLDTKFLENMSKDIFSQSNLATLVEDASEDGYEAKVKKTFIVDGRLTAIPAREKKRLVLMHWLLEKFEFNREYPEKELNEVIKEFHPDYAFWRRMMVDYGVMQRKNAIYWRTNKEQA